MACNACNCFSSTIRVRAVVFTDLVIALFYTIYRVTNLSFVLKRIFGAESGQQVDKKFNSPEYVTIIKYSTVFLITASVLSLAVEIFLFFLLNNGARSKNYRHCKHWFIIRILIFLLSILGSLIEYVRDQYTFVNGILEIEKVYRIITLLIVRNFMQKIYKGMTDNRCNYTGSNMGLNLDVYPPSINIRSHSQSNLTF